MTISVGEAEAPATQRESPSSLFPDIGDADVGAVLETHLRPTALDPKRGNDGMRDWA
jgi:hypothetical protein